jgi:hypothetical protein
VSVFVSVPLIEVRQLKLQMITLCTALTQWITRADASAPLYTAVLRCTALDSRTEHCAAALH